MAQDMIEIFIAEIPKAELHIQIEAELMFEIASRMYCTRQ